jgi:alkanesulfonate monooxygenase SsuD/methylene tetrahydromethanopterin reductase-like flavin-dependent oxidoreductase (luciferase family)
VIPGSVNLIPEAPIAGIVALAQHAEAVGFDRCWVYDEGLATRDVYVTLTAIAAATSAIKLGTGITNPYTRHPSTTAATIASLDEYSGGRAFLGLGAGGSLTLDPLGVDRSQPLRAVRETLQACRGLFSGRPTTMEGRDFTLSGATLGFARLDSLHIDFVGEAVALVRQGAAHTGNRPTIMYSTMVVTNERELATARAHMTYRLVDSQPQVKQLLGITEDDVARIRSAMSEGLEAAGEHVKVDWVYPFVFAGSPEECAAQLAQMIRRHGIDEFLLPVLDLEGAPEAMSTVAHMLEG